MKINVFLNRVISTEEYDTGFEDHKAQDEMRDDLCDEAWTTINHNLLSLKNLFHIWKGSNDPDNADHGR